MALLKSSKQEPNLTPDQLDPWFAPELQRYYVSRLAERVGMTRRRSEYFIRLWGYLVLKERQENGIAWAEPITRLTIPEGFISCTHHEAFDLFYADRDRGSERSAGMMLDNFAKLGLIKKVFDGNTIRLEIQVLPQIIESPEPESTPTFFMDWFQAARDTILVATFLAENYNWMNRNTNAVPQKIARLLRAWAQQYPKGMRVLRQHDTQRPVGFYILFPVAQASEGNFFNPPSKGLHLSTPHTVDPFTMATPGDVGCHSIFVRSWMINRPQMTAATIQQLLTDAQAILPQVRLDFPNACDLYGLTIHPIHEEIGRVIGFERITTDPQLSIHWLYLAIDQFLETDLPSAMQRLKF